MSKQQLKTSTVKNCENANFGFKVIEFNVSDSTESLYAVVTPVKNMK
jgi:hypothetical protein